MKLTIQMILTLFVLVNTSTSLLGSDIRARAALKKDIKSGVIEFLPQRHFQSPDYEGFCSLSSSFLKSGPPPTKQQVEEGLSCMSFEEALKQHDIKYSPAAIDDKNPATAWVEGVDGPGIGEVVLIEMPIDSRAQIWAGFGKSQRLFERNCRPKDIRVYTFIANKEAEEGIYEKAELVGKIETQLSDINAYQNLPLPPNPLNKKGIAQFVAIEILSVYEGSNYGDTCISEVRSLKSEALWLQRPLLKRPWPCSLRGLAFERGSLPKLIVYGNNWDDNKKIVLKFSPESDEIDCTECAKPNHPKDPLRSPDGRYLAKLELNNDISVTIEDKMKNTKMVVIKEPYSGDWSFGTGIWAPDGETFFFDNSGAAACIWRYNVNEKKLQKIVPSHDASCPVAYLVDGKLRIAYFESPYKKEAKVFQARPLSAIELETLLTGETNAKLPAKWRNENNAAVQLKQAGREYALELTANGEIHKWRIITIFIEGDGHILIGRRPAGGLLEVCRLTMKNSQRNEARWLFYDLPRERLQLDLLAE